MAVQFTQATFEPHLASIFTLEPEEGRAVDLELTEVEDRTPPGFPGVQFALTFEGPERPALEQRIYSMRHDGLGPLDLFLVPVGVNGRHRIYEAFFNLLPG